MTRNIHHSRLTSRASQKAKLTHMQQEGQEKAIGAARQRGIEAAADPNECALIPVCYQHKPEEGGAWFDGFMHARLVRKP